MAQGINAAGKSQGRAVHITHETVDQNRFFAQRVFNGLHGVIGYGGFNQFDHRPVIRLDEPVPIAVQHVFRWPAGHRPGALFVQAMFHQGAAGDRFVDMAWNNRAFGRGCGHRSRAIVARQRSAKPRERLFSRQHHHVAREARCHGGSGTFAGFTAPDHLEAALVGRVNTLGHGGIAQQIFLNRYPGTMLARTFNDFTQQLVGLDGEQQRWCVLWPGLLQNRQQVTGIDRTGRPGTHKKLYPCQLPQWVPQGLVAQRQVIQDGLGHASS